MKRKSDEIEQFKLVAGNWCKQWFLGTAYKHFPPPSTPRNSLLIILLNIRELNFQLIIDSTFCIINSGFSLAVWTFVKQENTEWQISDCCSSLSSDNNFLSHYFLLTFIESYGVSDKLHKAAKAGDRQRMTLAAVQNCIL